MAKEKSKDRPTLGYEGFYLLTQWVSQNAERIMRERPAFVEGAEQAGSALNLPVNDKNFKRACEVAGVKYEHRTALKSKSAERLAALEQTVTSLNGLVGKLTTELLATKQRVDTLCDELGVKGGAARQGTPPFPIPHPERTVPLANSNARK